MASIDIKRKHEEVKAKFGVIPFQIKNEEVRCKHCKAVRKYNTATTPVMHHLYNIT